MNVILQLKKIPFAKFPPSPQSMLVTLSGTMVISCLANIVQGGGGDVLPRFGILENSPKMVKCVINFATDCGPSACMPKIMHLSCTYFYEACKNVHYLEQTGHRKVVIVMTAFRNRFLEQSVL